MEKEAKKLNGKDLIQIGIYAAIYYVIVCVVAMLGMILSAIFIYPFHARRIPRHFLDVCQIKLGGKSPLRRLLNQRLKRYGYEGTREDRFRCGNSAP